MSDKQERQPRPEGDLDRADFVIIGNGIAGLSAAVEARRLAPEKRIVIISDQLHPTINTPALKQFAIARLTREQLLAYPAGTERAERIHVVNAHVEEIQAQQKYLVLKGKRQFGYNSLLIATGSTPQGLPENIPGRGFDGVMTLHRLQDYLDLRRRIPEVREAVVIGGGVHANETVMGLLHWGIRVHWLIRGKVFMNRILDETASEMVLEKVRRAGAEIHMETEMKGVMGRVGAVAGVITNRHEMIPCQLVLTCTGTRPAQGLAQRCSVPMLHKNGILVDEKLRTSVRDIYAAGDVAALLNPQTGTYETRPQWFSAVNLGRLAGALMAGEGDVMRQPFGVPWHATHLGDLSMLTVGEPLGQAEGISILTDNSGNGYRRLALAGDRLVGYLSLGSTQPDSLAIKQIIDEGYPVRSVMRELLKGTIDARAQLSGLGSRAGRGLVTGRLPMPAREEAQAPASRRQSETGPLVMPRPTRQTDPLRLNPPRPERQVQPAPAASQPPRPLKEQRVIFEEEPSPFTGNLPAVSQLGMERHTDDIRPQKSIAKPVSPVPASVNPASPIPAIFEEEPSPFTGNLPALSNPALALRPSEAGWPPQKSPDQQNTGSLNFRRLFNMDRKERR